MGFSSFCLWQAGEHAVRWSQPVGARIARPIGAFRLKGQRMCPRFTGKCGLRGRLAHKRRGNRWGSPLFCFREACCLLLVTRRGAHCAPDWGVSAEGGNVCARASRGECGLRGRLAHKRRGNQNGSPCLLRITTPSFRARCARRSKSLFCCAARPPQRVSRTGATPEQQARIARTRQRPVGWYPSFLLLMADGRQGGRSHLPLRAKRALICGSKCRKSFFFSLGGLLRAKKEKR